MAIVTNLVDLISTGNGGIITIDQALRLREQGWGLVLEDGTCTGIRSDPIIINTKGERIC